ncbi:hypothetical protein [Sphingomonas sp. Leaf25]|uniref:hypothetical protein n=1 Tax=Sphingomonas sp. Leaf25 TaxID=1735692 RepID=UPI0012E0E3E7|nr:hypothetical protein [Sphingomonas sp. Leaf25]
MVPLTPGPESLPGQAFEGDRLDMPVVIVSALGATGTRVEDFLARLVDGPIWQDQSIRSPDRKVDIQAYLAPEGLRCVIRLREGVWYHHAFGTLHVWGMPLPPVRTGEHIPLTHVLRHDMLDNLPIMVRAATELNARTAGLGTCLRVDMPMVTMALPRHPSSNTDGV